jgi:ATP-dependent Clp protease ATP-binding subunit ClpA
MSDTILVFTSNIGTEDAIAEGVQTKTPVEIETTFLKAVEAYFRDDLGRPELYGRLKNGLVVFQYIDREVGKKVLNDKFAQVERAMRERLGDAAPGFPEEVRAFVHDKANVETYGLRDVNNAMHAACGGAIGRVLDGVVAVEDIRFHVNGHKVEP